MPQFVQGCIAAGCDYLKNIRGVGINKAFTFVKSGQLFHELKKKGAPDLYERWFANVVAVFMHQTVFDPTKLEVQPLAKWDKEPDNQLQSYCGAYPFYIFIDCNFDKFDACKPTVMGLSGKDQHFPQKFLPSGGGGEKHLFLIIVSY